MTAQVFSPRIREAQVFPQVRWPQFEAIDRAFDAIPGVRLRYLDNTLEIMPISEAHEDFKAILRLLLEAYFRAKGIRFYARGGPSLGDETLGARSEPDEAYNLGTRKPYPDLVLEVVITSGGIDKLEGYRRMGVAEVWFREDGVLTLYGLRDNHSGYDPLSQSRLLPDLPLEAFCRYVTYHDQFDAVDEFLRQIG
ncbi:Uma2 family endonuclease [Phormidium sp. FACHB-1136]|uniref:Uma2 family endonuclease n=1 Tax=Phormidium sp. FACHB-1136 TaxID=2692848 RepID=UPI00168869AE|nr:Uma2 family endonuclease [Phormidium sp. FACHB-1136]MBD2428711.1 Uma2 family endonuclease [Phormidium sp. FACHB-1136]